MVPEKSTKFIKEDGLIFRKETIITQLTESQLRADIEGTQNEIDRLNQRIDEFYLRLVYLTSDMDIQGTLEEIEYMQRLIKQYTDFIHAAQEVLSASDSGDVPDRSR